MELFRSAATKPRRDVLAGVLPPSPEDLHPTDLSPGWGVPSQIVKVEILASTPLKALSELIFHNDSFVVHTLRGRSGKVDPKKRQRYSNEFRREAVERMRGGNNIVRLARDLGVCRRVLYNWRDQLDESNAPPTRTRELMLRKQILRLKRLLANKTLEVDFFRHALQRVGARRRQNFHPGDKASTMR